MSDLKIEIWNSFNEAFFIVEWEKEVYHTSEKIAELFGLDKSEYNDLLIDKVIQHRDFSEGAISGDVSFNLNDIPMETYYKRFEETFASQIVLLKLGGV